MKERLKKIYNGKKIRRNAQGRRKALPSEIKKHLKRVESDTFEEQERFHQPTLPRKITEAL